MMMVEAGFLIGLVGLMIYGLTSFLLRPQDPRRLSSLAGRWRVAHYDTRQETHVVLRKVSSDGMRVLDEHVIATVRSDDPEYDDKFLAAMAVARQRQALFEAEEGA
jgi:hypothetical protein